MDKEKTGQLIASARKERGMTQQELAEQLHITSKAVSKWERGLSFPSVDILESLADVLDLSVVDLLAGEVVEPVSLPARAEEISLGAVRREKRAKRRAFLACVVMVAALSCFIIWSSLGPTIFQRGNPIPYLSAAENARPYLTMLKSIGVLSFWNRQGADTFLPMAWTDWWSLRKYTGGNIRFGPFQTPPSSRREDKKKEPRPDPFSYPLFFS